MEDVFIGEEAELPKKVTIDVRPSKEEVELHNKTHLPYRSWCPHCVRGKARRRAHKRKRRDVRGGVPVISVDYMWMKGKATATRRRRAIRFWLCTVVTPS